jgi:hypothetical protein
MQDKVSLSHDGRNSLGTTINLAVMGVPAKGLCEEWLFDLEQSNN